ncbi:MAG: hypothetical protein AMXMBFR61_08470 [Fimbriimonadales bacterium]
MSTSTADFVLPFDNREIALAFDAGKVSSDAGLLLLKQVDRRLGRTQRLGACLPSGRRGKRWRHTPARCFDRLSMTLCC